jgi:hypothetical protein
MSRMITRSTATDVPENDEINLNEVTFEWVLDVGRLVKAVVKSL